MSTKELEYNELFKNIYGVDLGVPELTFNDFVYKNNKLYIKKSIYFPENKGIIVFYAPWCKHCRKISEIIIDLSNEYTNLFYFGAVNVENIKEKNDHLAVCLGITKLPWIMSIEKDYSLKKIEDVLNEDNLIYYINTHL